MLLAKALYGKCCACLFNREEIWGSSLVKCILLVNNGAKVQTRLSDSKIWAFFNKPFSLSKAFPDWLLRFCPLMLPRSSPHSRNVADSRSWGQTETESSALRMVLLDWSHWLYPIWSLDLSFLSLSGVTVLLTCLSHATRRDNTCSECRMWFRCCPRYYIM